MALCQYVSAMGAKRQRGEFHLPGKNVTNSSEKMGVIKTGKKLGRHFVGSTFLSKNFGFPRTFVGMG